MIDGLWPSWLDQQAAYASWMRVVREQAEAAWSAAVAAEAPRVRVRFDLLDVAGDPWVVEAPRG